MFTAYRNSKLVRFSNVILVGVILSTIMSDGVSGHSTGVDTAEGCSKMLPQHWPNFRASTDQCPVSMYAYIYEEHVRVSIKSSDNFKGFIIKALSVSGKFVDLPTGTKLTCNDFAVTHADSIAKREIEFRWLPEGNICENIVFVATVVKDYSTFWSNVTSSVYVCL